MFTGLVETLGKVTSLEKTGNGIRLSLKPLTDFKVQLGDSISVNGVCLTVTENKSPQSPPLQKGGRGDLSFDISPETMRSTNLGELSISDKVNLERALRLSDRLGGHMVTGHVDGVSTISDKRQSGEYTFYKFESSNAILNYVVKKGSIAVDGVSLTVIELDNRSFSVAIIPHTLKATNIGDKRIGDKVNIEVDIIGKYVEKFLSRKDTDKGLMELLKAEGFAE
ncbi:MAG: riboflavin synthase [Nitrospirae bacterium]|nr:riboflavin synthase [Nitrospirota bacterium]